MSEAADNTRVGVLASGRGSNFESLVRRERQGYFAKARFACLISDVPGARALEVAAGFDIPAFALPPRSFASKAAYEREICGVLSRHRVSLVVLAGYMRIVGPTLLEAFPQKILNIHPTLLPSFPGLHGQLQALEYGVKVSGCTVHFVDAGVDTGPIIGQRAVPVLDDDTEDALSVRILEQEHLLYADAVQWVTERPYVVDGRVVRFGDSSSPVA